MENPEESVISETSKHLNGLNTYDRNSMQTTNMVTPAYEHTLPRLTTVYPAPDLRGIIDLIVVHSIKHD